MNPNPNKRPAATDICHRVGYWLDEMKQDDDDNEVKKQFFEADEKSKKALKKKIDGDEQKINIKPKLKSKSLIHSNDMYTSKSINIRKITEALKSKTQGINSHLYGIAEEEISKIIEAVEITDN
ncbi:hypothetical protein F8M41_013709 [Gigaspora margarita]|uniref:Uncharacterized protein n=1 Tax=Gigaspora margarita TaxID=4874 RepID=A0A8H3ZYM9_GIGMA|nr:hypothetical protein F8M41_013709 [Gigaspora margarita]